jgi:hypothetical protein
MLDPQNCRCRSLIQRAYFELIVTAPVLRSGMPIFSRGRPIVGRRRRKSACAGYPVSAKAACRKWRSLCRYRPGLAGHRDVGYFSWRKQTPLATGASDVAPWRFLWWVIASPSLRLDKQAFLCERERSGAQCRHDRPRSLATSSRLRSSAGLPERAATGLRDSGSFG